MPMLRFSLLAGVSPLCCSQDLFLGQSRPSRKTQFGGLTKNTWSVNEPRECAAWFFKYMPGVEYEDNECPSDVCPCATEGRVRLPNAFSANDFGFGIHTVNTTFHPTGRCNVAELEKGFQAKYANMSTYTPLMDFNLGMWAHSLDQVLDKFEADDVSYYPMTWVWEGKPYFSAMANPCGSVLIEFMSDKIGDRDTAGFNQMPSRMQFVHWNGPHAPRSDNPLGLYPLKISRAVTEIEKVTLFYQQVFRASILHKDTHSDGTVSVTLEFPATASGRTTVHFQLWSRPEPPPASEDSCSEWTVAKWENYKLDVHNTEMRGPACGMDRWLDNHFALNCEEPSDFDECDTAVYVAGFDRWGVKYRVDPKIKPERSPDPFWFVYSYDPSGEGVELHFAHWTDGPLDLVNNTPPSAIHGTLPNGTCAGMEPRQCT